MSFYHIKNSSMYIGLNANIRVITLVYKIFLAVGYISRIKYIKPKSDFCSEKNRTSRNSLYPYFTLFAYVNSKKVKNYTDYCFSVHFLKDKIFLYISPKL